MSRDTRKKLIESIEKKRGSKMIAYVTSDRPNLSAMMAGDTVSILHEHILAIDPSERGKLDLFLYSRGGSADVPWSIVSMFREYAKEGLFSVLIPYRAHSAATVIALGADEIVMTRKAELGPIDITLQRGPYNPKEEGSSTRLPVSVEDVTGYFSLLDRIGCERSSEKLRGMEFLTNEVHPLVLGSVNRLLEQTKLLALRLLGTRAKPFPEEKNRQILRRLSSEIYSHNHTIYRTEAATDVGLEQVVKAEDAAIDSEIWELYEEYRKFFSLEDPFQPEDYLITHDLEEHIWSSLSLACIESFVRLDVCRKDEKVRRLRRVPPKVTLNLNNLSMPPVNIPNLPEGTTPQQVGQLIQQMLPSIIQPILNTIGTEAAESLKKSLPHAGFEHMSFNSGWQTEE